MHSITSSLLDKILITFLLKCRRDVAIAKLYLHSLPSKNKGEKRFWKQNWKLEVKSLLQSCYLFVAKPIIIRMRKLDNKGALKQLNLVRLSKRFYTLKVNKFQNEIIVSPKIWTKNCKNFCPVMWHSTGQKSL